MRYPIGTVFRYATSKQWDRENRIVVDKTHYKVVYTNKRHPLSYLDGERLIIVSLPKEDNFTKLYNILKNE